MNLHIDNPRAYELAKQLAAKRNISVDEAIIEALESTLRKDESELEAIADRVRKIADDLWAKRGPN
ncbi:MAG: type II toxin-antitoxin system VapB family antitoxin, partial [Rhizobiaceae bacterium]